jgi:hypothetical protein
MPRSRQRSGLVSRVVICSWLALQEYLATYAATCPGVELSAVFGAGQGARVQLLAEANLGRLTVAGIALEAGSTGGLTDRVAAPRAGSRRRARVARSLAPSRRTIAWKCTSPRVWNSATFA